MTDVLTLPARNALVENAINKELVQTYLKSPNDISHQAINIPNRSESNFNITVYPPGINSILDAKVYLRCNVTVTGQGANLAITPDQIVPCNMPLASSMDQLSVSLNGTSCTSRPAELLNIYQFIHTDSDYRALSSAFSPTQPDYSSSVLKQGSQFTQFIQAYDGNAFGGTNAPIAANFVPVNFNNPNSPYADTYFHARDGGFGETNRKNFPHVVLTAPGGTFANTIQYTFCEPLLSPIFEDNPNVDKGLFNLKFLQLDIRWMSNLKRMFQSVDGTAKDFNVTFTKAELLIKYVVPSETALENQLVLPYSEWTLITESFPGLTNVPSNTVVAEQTTANLTWSIMPSNIIVYVRPKLSVIDERDSHSIFGCIEGINLQVSSRSGLLANMTPQQLWAMSVKNGLDLTYEQWSKSTGGPVIIKVGEDIPFVPAVSGRVSAQINVKVKNRAWQDRVGDAGNLDAKFNTAWELCVLSELQGKVSITPDSASVSLGLNFEEINQAEDFDSSYTNVIGRGAYLEGEGVEGEGVVGGFLPILGMMAAQRFLGKGRGRIGAGIHGGSFWGSIKRGAKNFYKTQIKPLAREVLDTAKIQTANQLYNSSSLGQPGIQGMQGMGVLNR